MVKIELATQLFWEGDSAFPVDRHEAPTDNCAFEYDVAIAHAFLEMVDEYREQMGDSPADAMLEKVAEVMGRYGYECPLIDVDVESL